MLKNISVIRLQTKIIVRKDRTKPVETHDDSHVDGRSHIYPQKYVVIMIRTCS